MEETILETTSGQGKRQLPEQLIPFQFKKGQSGNPSGSSRKQTMKEYARERFLSMTDEEKDKFLDGLSKIDLWKMAEGAPDARTDMTTKIEAIISPEAKAKANKAISNFLNNK